MEGIAGRDPVSIEMAGALNYSEGRSHIGQPGAEGRELRRAPGSSRGLGQLTGERLEIGREGERPVLPPGSVILPQPLITADEDR